MTETRPHVVIIGAGFGGLEAAQRLAKAPVRLTLIDRHNYHLFQPLLYQVAIAGLSSEEIAYPVRAIFRRQHNVVFRMDEVTSVDLDSRVVHLGLERLSYDYLILAVGARTNFFKHSSLEQNSLQVKDIAGAVAIRNHLLEMFETASHEPDPVLRRKLLTFVIAGGGPTGVETAGALSELIRLVFTKDYPGLDLREVQVLLLEAGPSLIPAFPSSLQAATVRALLRKHVEVRLRCTVVGYDGEDVKMGDGSTIPARTLIWTAGVRAAALVDTLGVPQSGGGRARVASTLQLPGHPEVYCIGDAAYFEQDGEALPLLATVALQEARLAAGNIRRAVAGRAALPFQYRDPGLLATIGRNAAVATFGGISFHGFPAWLIWVVLHIFRIIGFRNRLVVLINWAWDYFLYYRAVRLITSE